MKLINEGVYDKWIFKAVFLAGGPGSGKNFFQDKTLHSFKKLDPDEIRTVMLRKKGISTDTSKQSKSDLQYRLNVVDPAAYEKTAKKEKSVVAGRLPVVMNRTGRDYEVTADVKKKLEDLGYETKMIFVDTDLETSLSRNKARDRKLEKELVTSIHKDTRANIDKFRSLFGNNFYIIDNSKPISENKSEYDIMWKKIARWMREPVKNAKAEAWRQEELRKKDRRVTSGLKKVSNEIKRIN